MRQLQEQLIEEVAARDALFSQHERSIRDIGMHDCSGYGTDVMQAHGRGVVESHMFCRSYEIIQPMWKNGFSDGTRSGRTLRRQIKVKRAQKRSSKSFWRRCN